jgi:hypothetical protein
MQAVVGLAVIQALVQAVMVVAATVAIVVLLRQLLELPIEVVAVAAQAVLAHPRLQHNQAVLVDLV